MTNHNEAFYKRLFWITVPAVLGSCGTLVGIGWRTSVAQTAHNAIVIERIDRLRTDVDSNNNNALRLFLEANAQITAVNNRLHDLRVKMAERGIVTEGGG